MINLLQMHRLPRKKLSSDTKTGKRNINTVVVGGGGMGIGQILARKIEDRIPEINVTLVLPASSALMIDEEQYDFVVTTISKIKIPHPYVAYTTPIVSQQDVYRIQKKCQQIQENKKDHKQEYTIGNLIKQEFILILDEVMDKEEVLKVGCDHEKSLRNRIEA